MWTSKVSALMLFEQEGLDQSGNMTVITQSSLSTSNSNNNEIIYQQQNNNYTQLEKIVGSPLQDWILGDSGNLAYLSVAPFLSITDLRTFSLTSNQNYLILLPWLIVDLSHRNNIPKEILLSMSYSVCGIKMEDSITFNELNEMLDWYPSIGRISQKLIQLNNNFQNNNSIVNGSGNGTSFYKLQIPSRKNLKIIRGSPGTFNNIFQLSFLKDLGLSGLTCLELNGNNIHGNYKQLSSLLFLKELIFKGGQQDINGSLKDLSSSCPLLVHLELSGKFINGNLLDLNILNKTLKYLSLENCSKLKGNLFHLKDMLKLEYLSISSTFSFIPILINGNLKSLIILKSLSSLNLRHCISIQGDISVLIPLNKLEYINLISCSLIKGPINCPGAIKTISSSPLSSPFQTNVPQTIPSFSSLHSSNTSNNTSGGYMYSSKSDWNEFIQWFIKHQPNL